MKKIVVLGCLLIILGVTVAFREEIVGFYLTQFFGVQTKVDTVEKNQYYVPRNYNYVTAPTTFVPENKEDIKNIYYEVINSGMTKFSFYCPDSYISCLSDVDYIANNQALLSYVNNFVGVFNTFNHIETEYSTIGEVTIRLQHAYTEDKISILNTKIDSIISQNITMNMTDVEKIKTIHDYIINNSVYDSARSDKKVTTYSSDTAYGVLIQGYGICSGYADAMKLFLDRFGIPNYKISSENHIWNLVYLDGKWLHLDLTWDDPVSSSGNNILEYDYFLITSTELSNLETDQHFFDKTIYVEATNN